MKYSPEIIESICEKLGSGKHSVAAICKAVGITEETFYTWKKDPTKSEFSESLKKAEKLRLASLGEMALSGLATRLQVQHIEETTLEMVDSKNGKGESVPKIKSKKVVTKIIQPSDLLIMFTLKNTHSDEFKDKHEIGGELTVRKVRATIRRAGEEVPRGGN